MLSQSASRYLWYASFVFALGGSRVFACGPDFPNSYLSNSFEEITALPTLSFGRELERLLPAPKQRLGGGLTERKLADAEATEVREALVSGGLSEREIAEAMANYRRTDPPAALPKEFHLYARGARAWHDGRIDEAVDAWRQVLALPEKERHFRTTWAAYMIGRALWDTDPESARDAFRRTQDSAARGFADSQDLATASLGWEARSYLRQNCYHAALQRYFQQFAHGDTSAEGSLQLTLLRLFRGASDPYVVAAIGDSESEDAAGDTADVTSVLATLADDKETRGIVTAWFASRGGPSTPWGNDAARQFAQWIAALPGAPDLTPAEADRWCWAAYQNGLWTEARRFAARAPDDAPASEWVRAMLLLRSGFVEDAATHLARAARAFPADDAMTNVQAGSQEDAGRWEWQPLSDNPRDHLAGLRGVLALRRERYTEALRLFLEAGHWSDAAFVGERVLTLDELTAFVRAECPEETADEKVAGEDARRSSRQALRHLLARRLVRAWRFDAATEFFPASERDVYRSYKADVRNGFDEQLPARRRAEALWDAAQIVHEHGMELQGTELEPDYAIWDGSFQWPELAKRCTDSSGAALHSDTADGRRPTPDAVLAPTTEELQRMKETRGPSRRFHYRYRATELAWLAAGLMPNDEDQTAEVLHTAGLWVAVRDPEYAELFYKSLVIRCPKTALGQAAANNHWFVRAD